MDKQTNQIGAFENFYKQSMMQFWCNFDAIVYLQIFDRSFWIIFICGQIWICRCKIGAKCVTHTRFEPKFMLINMSLHTHKNINSFIHLERERVLWKIHAIKMKPISKQMVIAFKVNGKALTANATVISNVTAVGSSNGFKVSPKSLFSI